MRHDHNIIVTQKDSATMICHDDDDDDVFCSKIVALFLDSLGQRLFLHHIHGCWTLSEK
jgi:hypothetical protein